MLKDDRLKLSTRLLIGGIAGFAGTMAMTAAMRRLHRRLPEEERYPLTPREIVDSGSRQIGIPLAGDAAKDVTTATHFLYGAAMGAVIAAMNPDPKKRTGAAAGLAVWLASYMGWIPAVGTLAPATRHPARRNALMIAVHLVWGWSTAAGIRELRLARETILEDGPDRDAPPQAKAGRDLSRV
ncbi:MAG: hypothetical protein JOZ90_07835 [Alphaproteobacteria bacterium]|nr:hypothetical protein [Alphaproteobacteria bacterium]MBV9372595.1 hypothetical protein [Alphaproteobacteria bacterium]MBV9900995.1 hypothetical protein [Alphaproteobacteria bacterium]